MKRSTMVINVVLAAAIVGTGTFAYFSLRPSTTAPTSAVQTATVQRGDVTATVSASGNLSSASQVSINFQGSAGTVTAIYVKVGDKVAAGQALAVIDDSAAKLSLQTARAQLASAEASYQSTASGETALARQADTIALKQAQQSLDSAQTSASQTQDTVDLDSSQQSDKLDAVRASYDKAKDALRAAKAAYDACDPSATPAPDCSTLQKNVDSAKTALTAAQNSLDSAQQAYDSAMLKNSQSLTNAGNQLSAAQLAYDAKVNQIAGNQTGPTKVQLTQARASLLNAQASVDNAQRTLDQTVLKAPSGGTVTSLNGQVGSSSSVSGSSGSGSSSSSSSSTASGLLVLTDLDDLRVVSMVAEADVARIKVGNDATITFSAVGITAPGKVTAIDLQNTVANNVVEYGVTVSLVNPPAGLRLGQTATVSITTGSSTNVLYVPSTAVTTVGNRSVVTVRENNRDAVVPVQVGLSGNNRTEITSGLQQGQTVVLSSGSSTTSGLTFPTGGSLGGVGGRLGG